MKTVFSICLTFLLALFFYQVPQPSIPIVKIGPTEAKPLLTVVNASEVFLVNMIPYDQSEESGQDSEPFLAVDPDQDLMVGAAAYGESVLGSQPPPLFLSRDGGKSWNLIFTIPAKKVDSQTYCFSGNGKSFYGSVATSGGQAGKGVSVFHTDNPTNNQPLQSISTLSSGSELADEPFVQARSFAPGANGETDGSETAKRVDRIYVGQNYFGTELGPGKTASVRVSVDGGKTFRLLGLEARSTGSAGQDGPAVRPAVADDGTVYVAFFHWTSKIGANYSGDVIVTRDDQGATSEKPFGSLTDPSDGLPGRIVANNRAFPFGEHLGQQRVGSPLSLAVDPDHSATLYLAWADFDRPLKRNVIHLERSTDRGQNWSADLLTIPSATNPALAVSRAGAVGLLYQQLQGLQPAQRWETHFQKSPDGVGGWTDVTLTTFPTAAEPPKAYDPYLGYKIHLLAAGDNFYGVFSAPNFPELKYFPQGVEFQRKYQNGKLFSKDGSREVRISIDPYFFRIPANGKTEAEAAFPETSKASKKASKNETARGWLAFLWARSHWATIALISIPVAIVAIGLFALIVRYREPRRLNRLLDAKIQAPPLTNYTGFLTARFTDSEGKIITELSKGSRCQLEVEFAKERPKEEWARLIDLQGGEDSTEVVFTVAIDTNDFEVSPDHRMVSVPAKGSADVRFSLGALDKVKEHSLFVQVFQRTQLVQVVTAKLSVRNQG